MKIKINVNYKLNKKITQQQAMNVLFLCMLKMQELAVDYCPVDTGLLSTSIKIVPSVDGSPIYVLTDGVEYGVDVEFGTSPHYVSAKYLKDWARRVLGDENAAYAVSRKIAKKGVNAQPFFRPALYQVKDIWVERYWNSALK